MMAFGPLVWYCRPVEHGVWAKAEGSAFGAYTPCGVCTLVVCISHLVLLALCSCRLWLIKMDFKVQRFCLRSNYYNYMLGFLAFCCTAEPLLRLIMGVSVFNLDGQTEMAPFEASFLFILFSWFVSFQFALLRWNLSSNLACAEKHVIQTW